MKHRNIANVFSSLHFKWKKRRSINKNDGISFKLAVVSLYIIYGTLNYWCYIKSARICKTKQKQKSSHWRKVWAPEVSNIWAHLICISEILKTLSLSSSLLCSFLETSQTCEFSVSLYLSLEAPQLASEWKGHSCVSKLCEQQNTCECVFEFTSMCENYSQNFYFEAW